MSAVDTIIRSSQSLPDIRAAHWLPRIVLASVIAYQGFIKFPLAADDAVSAGVPYILWILTALVELADRADHHGCDRRRLLGAAFVHFPG